MLTGGIALVALYPFYYGGIRIQGVVVDIEKAYHIALVYVSSFSQ